MKVVQGIVEDNGQVRLLDDAELASGQRVIVALIDDGGVRSLDELEGCVPYNGPPISIEDMNSAIAAEGSGS